MIFKKLSYKQGVINQDINEELKKNQIVHVISETDTHVNVSLYPTSKLFKILKKHILIF